MPGAGTSACSVDDPWSLPVYEAPDLEGVRLYIAGGDYTNVKRYVARLPACPRL